MRTTTRRRGLWTLLALLLIGCATLATRYATAADGLRPALRISLDEDSIRVRLAWSPVRDARGDEVARYVATLTDSGEVVATGETTDTTWTAALPRVPGDTLRLRGEVYAVDIRGTRGAVGRSSTTTIAVPDPGPPAPDVRLDTIPIAMSGYVDSLRVFFPAAEVDEGGTIRLAIGESVQGCVVAWYREVAFRPMDQAAECLQYQGAAGAGAYRIALAVETR